MFKAVAAAQPRGLLRLLSAATTKPNRKLNRPGKGTCLKQILAEKSHNSFARIELDNLDSRRSLCNAGQRNLRIRKQAAQRMMRKLHPKGFRSVQRSTGPFADSLCLLCAGVAENANQPGFYVEPSLCSAEQRLISYLEVESRRVYKRKIPL